MIHLCMYVCMYLQAMSKAEVGDDVYREDPTVDQLEREVAALMGHESGI